MGRRRFKPFYWMHRFTLLCIIDGGMPPLYQSLFMQGAEEMGKFLNIKTKFPQPEVLALLRGYSKGQGQRGWA